MMATSYLDLPQRPTNARTIGPLSKDAFYIPNFDPAIHLAFEPPSKRYSFTELGLPRPQNAPNVCFTEPFQLFSEEGVRMIRRELFRKEFLDKYMRSWSRAPCYISGHANHENEATFIKQAWHHPATQAAINEAFGAALKPLPREQDLGYVNVQLGNEGLPGVYKYTEEPTKPLSPSEAAANISKSEYDNIPVDSWHKDMVPVVCVLMLSDTSTMEGGETAIKKGDGSIIKARGAKIGGAVLMQGGRTEHAALRATNCPERVSMVTSYCFADPDADDSCTTLRSVDPVNDDKPTLWNVYLEYKLKRLRDRIDTALEKLDKRRQQGEIPTRTEIEPWIREQVTFLKMTSFEMFERVPNYLLQEVPDDVLRNYLSDV
ncbi:hypothetical protein V1517DRAFT_37072 [Lipomyces orientalis]|uniref:Uncharacterized protein n=1 Tax=Lipomyces orientalis TaxID=1233043 RepID=A0ACC3TFR1_9ASCO